MNTSKHDIIDLVDESNDEYEHSKNNNDFLVDLCEDDELVGVGLSRQHAPSKQATTVGIAPALQNQALLTHRASHEEKSCHVARNAARRLTYSIPDRNTTKPTQSVISVLESDDDDSDDDSLLDENIGLKRKDPVAKLISTERSRKGDDESDDDTVLDETIGLKRKAPVAKLVMKERPRKDPKQKKHSMEAILPEVTVQNPYSNIARGGNTPTVRGQNGIPEPFPYPFPLTAHAKLYPDVRARLLLSSWKYGRSLTRDSYNRPKLDVIATRVHQLALCNFPIRSLEEWLTRGPRQSVTTFRQQITNVREELRRGSWESIKVNAGINKFYSITEACLVALSMSVASMPIESTWVPLSDLIPRIDSLLDPMVPGKLTRRGMEDNGAGHYLESSTRSIEFLQIKKLEVKLGDCGPYIKRHRVKGEVQYELLPEGLTVAEKIRAREFPAPPGAYRCSKIESLRDVDDDYKTICVGVDYREGGGGTCTLHRMCNTLDIKRVPFFVASLMIGDYVFFTRDHYSMGPMNLLCPVLVERKSIQVCALRG